jgi:cytochrome c5
MTRLLPCAGFALLAACSQDPAPAPATLAADSAAAVAAAPADPKLARLYAQTCKACHTSPGSGAPQAGDRQAWAPRVTQGMPVLLEHTIRGHNGMPPLGSCMDCSEPEFEALIRFMAGLEAG